MLNEQKYNIVEAVNKETHEGIPEGEPVFLLRARDKVSFDALLAYLALCQEHKCRSEHLRKIVNVIAMFNSWQEINRNTMKLPD